ncbi:TraR/DksA family transcriptional regulator [Methylocystis echinoides]|uniref:TraR/DksA family transcriptional regulator n=1 Tax=Methylocystis echinoides TaxID=29468 RepID=UPI002490A2B3|nr:TraR/DksA family transcriptional regulator [Methylocystis echinoides]
MNKGQAKRLIGARIWPRRISLGTYGVCTKCGEPIDPRRLKVVPTAARCISCAG